MNYPTTTNTQLIATCFFMKGEAVLEDYRKYYPLRKSILKNKTV